MARRIEHTATHACSPAELHAALTDRAYWEARLEAVGGTGATLDSFTAAGGGAEVALTQVIAAANLPSIVQKLKSGDLAITRTEAWGPLTGDGTTAEVTAEVGGTPASVTGTTTVSGDDTTTTVRTDGQAKVPVPFVGGKIEQAVADNVVKLLVAEARFTDQWLAGR